MNAEPGHTGFGRNIENGAQSVGSVLVLDGSLEPQAVVGAPDLGASGVDATTGRARRRAQLAARRPAPLRELVHAQQRAAQGARAA